MGMVGVNCGWHGESKKEWINEPNAWRTIEPNYMRWNKRRREECSWVLLKMCMKNVRGYKIIKIADSLFVCVHDCHPSAVLVGMIKTSCISETPLVLNNYLFNYWTGHDSNNERLIPRAGHFDHYHYEFTSFSQFWVQGRQLQGSPSETLQNDKKIWKHKR